LNLHKNFRIYFSAEYLLSLTQQLAKLCLKKFWVRPFLWPAVVAETLNRKLLCPKIKFHIKGIRFCSIGNKMCFKSHSFSADSKKEPSVDNSKEVAIKDEDASK